MKIKDGNIIDDKGKIVGTAFEDYKHGYHPCVLVKVGKDRGWFEWDTKDLVNTIIKWTKKKLEEQDEKSQIHRSE